MKKLFTKEQEKYIIENYNQMSYKEIAQKIGCNITSTQIASWLSNNGYKKTNRSIFTDEAKDFFKANYKNMAYKDMANIFGYSERQVRSWINNNCCKKNRSFNENYFDNIEKPNQAYWLGFLYADGWVIYNSRTHNYELGLELKSTDYFHLEKFNLELGGKHIIKYHNYNKYICNTVYKSKTKSCCIRVYSKKIVDALIVNGVVPNKTDSPIFPIVNNNLFFDFLRGYIDGDGCIYLDKKGGINVNITSSNYSILEYIQKTLINNYNIKSYIYKEKDKKYRFYVSRSQSMTLLDMIYYDSNLMLLDRKFQIYLNYKNNMALLVGNNQVTIRAKSVNA